MRGTHLKGTVEAQEQRFIPAHAGNTAPMPVTPVSVAVHPRACGEHSASRRSMYAFTGSSPRMRGTLVIALARQEPRRFIPAHAGNTGISAVITMWTAVHPRACGEHWACALVMRSCDGSSPRMRGTQPFLLQRVHFGRFIPAHAGNTMAMAAMAITATVHPRACGEHMSTTTPVATLRGSSPRMRGTPRRASLHSVQKRFIPAHAGNTPSGPRP